MIFSNLGRPKPSIKKLLDNGWKPSVIVLLVLIAPVYLLTAWSEYRIALGLIPYDQLLVAQIEADLDTIWNYQPK